MTSGALTGLLLTAHCTVPLAARLNPAHVRSKDVLPIPFPPTTQSSFGPESSKFNSVMSGFRPRSIETRFRRMEGVSGGLFLIFQALNQNTQFFENPSEVVADGFEPRSDIFKIGGLVTMGTVETKGLRTTFLIEDFEREMARELSVTYTGALPDLFREGQGVVVSGRLVSPIRFMATEVLAKHDENYQPEINYRNEYESD